jgi:hypothetical protein
MPYSEPSTGKTDNNAKALAVITEPIEPTVARRASRRLPLRLSSSLYLDTMNNVIGSYTEYENYDNTSSCDHRSIPHSPI